MNDRLSISVGEADMVGMRELLCKYDRRSRRVKAERVGLVFNQEIVRLHRRVIKAPSRIVLSLPLYYTALERKDVPSLYGLDMAKLSSLLIKVRKYLYTRETISLSLDNLLV